MRTSAKVSLSLVSGVMLNIAVAWGCALAADLSPLAPAPPREGGWSGTAPINMHAEALFHSGFAQAKVLYRDERIPMSGRIYGLETSAGFSAAIPPWSGLAATPSGMDGLDVAAMHVTVELCGWPFLCLASTTTHSVAAAPPKGWGPRSWTREENLGFRVPWIASRCDQPSASRCLPLRPVWIPFLLNSCVLSMPALLAFAIPAIRARRRRRSGRCVLCAYPVAGGAGRICPECGRAT